MNIGFDQRLSEMKQHIEQEFLRRMDEVNLKDDNKLIYLLFFFRQKFLLEKS